MSEVAANLIKAAHARGLKNWPDVEIDFLARTVEKARPDFVGEWGTNTGESAWLFYHAAKLAGLRRCIIHSIDLTDGLAVCRPEDEGKERGYIVKDLPVHLHVGDGVTTALQQYELSGRDEPLFFVDGNHDADFVLHEIETIAARAPHAVMLLHDTNGDPGVALQSYVDAYPDRYDIEVLESDQGIVSMWPR